MVRTLPQPFLWIVLLFSLISFSPTWAQAFTVERAPEWDALFDRTSGWTGADGIYSIPLSGYDAAGGVATAQTFFLFSDTFIGEVDAQDRRLPGSTLVNNTQALLNGLAADPTQIQFFSGTNNQNQPQAVILPATPATRPGDWYWLQDGVALNNTLNLFGLRMKPGSGGTFNFAVAGVTLLTAPLNGPIPPTSYEQGDAPLFLPATATRGEVIFGGAIHVNTAQAGSLTPDGYVYIYGTQNDPSTKKLVVARVNPEDFATFKKWRYWDGFSWQRDIAKAATLTSRISSEFSVTPLGDGRYALVFQLDGLGREVALRIGSSPIGPFGPVISIWTCPEPQADPDIYTYNAKAHPHLSQPGELLISYNVNSFSFSDLFNRADIYRPRFIRLKLNPAS